MAPSFMMLIAFNALGLIVLTGLFIGYIRIMQRHRGYDGPFGSRNNKRNDDNDGGGGSGGFDLGLPKVGLPSGSSLNDWQTDRQPSKERQPSKF